MLNATIQSGRCPVAIDSINYIAFPVRFRFRFRLRLTFLVALLNISVHEKLNKQLDR